MKPSPGFPARANVHHVVYSKKKGDRVSSCLKELPPTPHVHSGEKKPLRLLGRVGTSIYSRNVLTSALVLP